MMKNRVTGATTIAAVITAAILWSTAFAADNAPRRAAGDVTVAEGGTATASKAAPAKPKFRGRLPRYYGKVVNDTQRKKIYEIQEKYFERDLQLRQELEKLQAERDAEIEGVLTPEQKQTLARLIAEAGTARASASVEE